MSITWSCLHQNPPLFLLATYHILQKIFNLNIRRCVMIVKSQQETNWHVNFFYIAILQSQFVTSTPWQLINNSNKKTNGLIYVPNSELKQIWYSEKKTKLLQHQHSGQANTCVFPMHYNLWLGLFKFLIFEKQHSSSWTCHPRSV